MDKNSNLNTNASYSQVNQVIIEDDDSQDKEFYRLQKDAEEKRKAGLEPTKSDDIIFEVNNKNIKNLNNSEKNNIIMKIKLKRKKKKRKL